MGSSFINRLPFSHVLATPALLDFSSLDIITSHLFIAMVISDKKGKPLLAGLFVIFLLSSPLSLFLMLLFN